MTQKNCSQRGFKALMVTQFLGALNDNLLKTVVSLLIVGTAGQGAPALSLAAAMFVIPYLLFSSYAGFLADRVPKSSIIRGVKIFELAIVVAAAYFLDHRMINALIALLFFMGLHSAIFSPAKYGILPELLDPDHLSKGNGYIQFWTFLAILLGTALGGLVMSMASENMLLPVLTLIAVSALGLAAAFFVTKTRPAFPEAKFRLNPFGEVFSAISAMKKDRALYLTLLALSFFWFIGAIFQLAIYLYAREMLHVGDFETAILVTSLALGIGIGSILAGRVSEGKVEMGLVPIGAIAISVFSITLGFSYQSYGLSLALLFALGLGGGFYVVPLSAFIQRSSPLETRGRYLAANNFVSFSGVLLASLVLWVLNSKLGLNSAQCFLAIGVMTIAATIMIFRTLPEAFVRCVNWILMHTVYRVTVRGRERIPAQGGALLVCNHASFVDPSLLLGALERPVRFLMFRPIYERKFIHWFAKTMKAIPVSPHDSPEQIANSLKEAQQRLSSGELVCIFAEGSITRTGNMLPFRRGFERIAQGLSTPIIPVHIDRVWGSIFSFTNGKFLWKLPKRLPYPITISFGDPMPSTAKAHEVREAVQRLSSDAFLLRSADNAVLQRQFIREVRHHPFRPCIADSSGKRLNFGATAIAACALARVLRRKYPNQRTIGIMLPPSVGGALANIATLLSGRVPVNLNYTAGQESILSACRQARLETVISSRRFLEKLENHSIRGVVDLESLLPEISTADKLSGFIDAFFKPLPWLARSAGWHDQSLSDLATVIFSSGSTAEPKGVMLSHGNISSNIQSLYDLFQTTRHDCILGVLPFFHSFGFTATLWFPLLAGTSVVYHYNPLDTSKIGEIVRSRRASILMATPTFLAAYTRKCSREDFSSLRLVIVGAEKLKESVATAFEEKFGIPPLEGYGCTELSPVAVLNVPNFESGRLKQLGQKPGKVGHPIPGVVARVVDIESGRPLPSDKEGLLLVRGPNVMLGYLNNPQKTAEVIQDGWYITGDIASVDKDGFVAITDRLSRFSKIGGEMVPHVKIEEEIHAALGATEQVCVVTSVPDEKRGERLVVLCAKEVDAQIVAAKLSERGMPNLWIPKREYFATIEEIPLLGSGKIDLRAIRELAKARFPS